MTTQKGVLLSDTAYEAVTDAINRLDMASKGQYHVVWRSETHDHGTTTYRIVGQKTEVGERALVIEGGRGGRYEIIPKPNNPAWIRYVHPSSPSGNWEEELVHLAVLTPEFEYINEDGLSAFLSRAKQFVTSR